jgi:hypothetical protein
MSRYLLGQLTARACVVIAPLALVLFVAVPAARAEANNVTQSNADVGVMTARNCSRGSLSGASFSVPNAGDFIIVQAGIGYSDGTVVDGHYRVDALNTPSDSMGNTYSFINGSGVGGASTGHWAGMWMAKASSSGSDIVTWDCSFPAAVTQAAGSVVGTFTSNGPTHTLSVDTSNSINWNYWYGAPTNVTSVTESTAAATTAANDLVVNGGYIREHVWLDAAISVTGGEPTLTFSGVNYASGQTTSGTQWSDYNIGAGTSEWASGTTPTDTYNFVGSQNNAGYRYSVGASVIAALTAS